MEMLDFTCQKMFFKFIISDEDEHEDKAVDNAVTGEVK